MSCRGSSLLEFALALAVLGPVVVGLARLGATAWVLDEMQTVVRDGAMYASAQPLALDGLDDALAARVRNVVVYGRPDGGGPARIPGLEPRHVQVSLQREDAGPGWVAVAIAGYEAPGGVVRLAEGPRAVFPHCGRIAGQ